jgi:hypothetical protein
MGAPEAVGGALEVEVERVLVEEARVLVEEARVLELTRVVELMGG